MKPSYERFIDHAILPKKMPTFNPYSDLGPREGCQPARLRLYTYKISILEGEIFIFPMTSIFRLWLLDESRRFLVLSIFFPNSTLAPKFMKKFTEEYKSTMNNHEFFQIFLE